MFENFHNTVAQHNKKTVKRLQQSFAAIYAQSQSPCYIIIQRSTAALLLNFSSYYVGQQTFFPYVQSKCSSAPRVRAKQTVKVDYSLASAPTLWRLLFFETVPL